MDGLKLVCHELAKAAGDPDSGALDDLTKDADLLVSTLFIKVGMNFVFHEALVLDGFLDLDFFADDFLVSSFGIENESLASHCCKPAFRET